MAIKNQVTFAGGELAPALHKRVDQVKYATGLRTMRNFFILRHGGATNRPGTKFISEVADSTKATRIIPFEFNTAQTYVLELGDLILRPIRNDLPIRESTKVITTITVANPPEVTSTAHGYSNGDDVYITGVPGMIEVNNRTFKVANVAANTYELQDLGGTNIDGTGFTAHGIGLLGSSAKVYEIATIFAEAQLFLVKYTQSKDVMTFANVNYKPQELTRSGHAAWAIANKSFTPVQGQPVNVAGPAGNFNTYEVTSISDETFEESVPTVASMGTADPVPTNFVDMTWNADSTARLFAVYRRVNDVPGFVGFGGATSFRDLGLTPDTTDTPPQLRNPFGTSGNYPGAVGYFQQRLSFANTNNDPQTVWSSRSGLFKNYTISTPVKEDDAITIPMDGRKVNGIKHILELTSPIIFTDTGHFTLSGDAGGAVTPFAINVRQNGFRGSSDVPPLIVGSTVIFVQSRKSIVRDLVFDFATDGFNGKDLTIFSAHLFENLSIVDWAYQETPHSVIWAVRSDGVLLSLTYLPEHELWGWARHDTDGFFESVTSIPGTLEDDVYFVVRRTINGRSVRYHEKLDSRVITDIEDSIFMDASVTTDGTNTNTSVTMTLSGGTNWTEGELLTITASAATFSAGDVGDQIWLTGSGGAKVRFDLDNFTSTTIMTGRANEKVDSTLQSTATAVWGQATKTIRGLDHLEGENVSVFADGFVVASPNNASYPVLTVSGGVITMLTHGVVVQVGLPYICDIETLDIDSFDRPLTGKPKLINEVDVSLLESRGLFVGGSPPSDDTVDNKEGLVEMKIRNDEDYPDPVTLFTGSKKIKLENTWNSNGRVFIRQLDPLPVTVLAITPSGLLTAR